MHCRADNDKRQKVIILSSLLKSFIAVNDTIEQRAVELQLLGLKAYDALHVSFAEYAKADVLLTTDDNFLKKASKNKKIKIRIENPVVWLMEVINK